MGRLLRIALTAAVVGAVVAGTTTAGGASDRRAKKAADPLAQVAGPWAEVTGAQAVFAGATVSGVVPAGKGLVAYGTVGPTRALWSSPDGLRWTRVPDAALGLTAEQLAVPASGSRYSEFLVAGDDDGATAMVNRTVIATTDGTTWKKIADAASGTALRDPALASSFSNPAEFVDFTLRSLAVSGAERAAVGDGCWCAPSSSGDVTPFAVGSVDGSSWTGAPVWGNGTGRGEAVTVVATDDGFVAGGYAAPGYGRSDAAVWRSADGQTWTAVEDPALATPDHEKITRLAANGNRLLGLGSRGATTTASDVYEFFSSADGGATWTRSPVDPAVFGKQPPQNVLPLGDGFVVLGTVDDPEFSIPDPTAFTTTDGKTFTPAWTPQRLGTIGMTTIVERPDGLVALLPAVATPTSPAGTKVFVTGKLIKKGVKAKLATPPTTTTTTKAVKPSATAAR